MYLTKKSIEGVKLNFKVRKSEQGALKICPLFMILSFDRRAAMILTSRSIYYTLSSDVMSIMH